MITLAIQLWLAGTFATIAFYGLLLFYRERLLDQVSMTERANDGRWLLDALAWPVWAVRLWLPLLLVAAIGYPFIHGVGRLLSAKRWRKLWQLR